MRAVCWWRVEDLGGFRSTKSICIEKKQPVMVLGGYYGYVCDSGGRVRHRWGWGNKPIEHTHTHTYGSLSLLCGLKPPNSALTSSDTSPLKDWFTQNEPILSLFTHNTFMSFQTRSVHYKRRNFECTHYYITITKSVMLLALKYY